MPPFWQITLLFCAGGLGTLSRFGFNHLFSVVLGWSAPYSTTVINILGCFCFGLFAEWLSLKGHWSPVVRTILLSGFFGAFTTFSTYMHELHSLVGKGAVLAATTGFTLQNLVGFLALAAGVLLVRS